MAMLRFLALGVFLCVTSACLADDYKPAICTSAVEYRGRPLHAPVAAAAYAKAAGELSGKLDAGLTKQFDAFVDEVLKKTSTPAMTAAVGIPGQGLWSTSRGLALVEPPTPLADRSYFHWASAGKAFTATVVMQLIAEQKLGYETPIARWFPKFPNAGVITIDHLLTHTSGIFSFNSDLKFREALGYHPPDKLIAIAARHGSEFCPGELWHYSNTGYVLLARIAEEIEGQPLHVLITKRILAPLKLTETVALAPRQQLAGLANGHVDRQRDPSFEPTTPFGAGNIASSAGDMLRFWQAILTGKLLPPAQVEQAFARLYPMFDSPEFYGRGVMLYEFEDRQKQKIVWLGHSGGTPGIKTVMAFDIEGGLYLAVALNGNFSAEASANKLRTIVLEHRAAAAKR
jgi:D-alanyl-D-alanine carboxypeptidase